MMHSIKLIREKANNALKSMSAQLIKAGEADATAEGRRQFVEETKFVQCVEEVRLLFPLYSDNNSNLQSR
jgi:hypothetical protein